MKPSVPDPNSDSFQSILRITLEEIGKINCVTAHFVFKKAFQPKLRRLYRTRWVESDLTEVGVTSNQQIKLNEIMMMFITSLLPYGLEVSTRIRIYMFFGQIWNFGGYNDWYITTIIHVFTNPFIQLESVLQFLYVWSVIVLIPLVLNILLILFSYRTYKSKASVHSIRYLAIGGLAYSVGLSMMSGILSLPITAIVVVILQTIHLRTSRLEQSK